MLHVKIIIYIAKIGQLKHHVLSLIKQCITALAKVYSVNTHRQKRTAKLKFTKVKSK